MTLLPWPPAQRQTLSGIGFTHIWWVSVVIHASRQDLLRADPSALRKSAVHSADRQIRAHRLHDQLPIETYLRGQRPCIANSEATPDTHRLGAVCQRWQPMLWDNQIYFSTVTMWPWWPLALVACAATCWAPLDGFCHRSVRIDRYRLGKGVAH